MTTQQRTLFPITRKRRDYVPGGRHETSRRAAVRVASSAPNMKQRILDFIREQGLRGATDPEIARALNLNPSSARPRRVDLERSRLIRVKPGLHTQHEIRAGARVWILAELLGRKEADDQQQTP